MRLLLLFSVSSLFLALAAAQCVEFTTVPQDTIAIPGQPVCLSCDYPNRSSERWSRDGVNIDPPSPSLCNCTQQTPTDNLLCIPSPSENDTGQYRCSVTIFPGVGCTTPPANLTLAEVIISFERSSYMLGEVSEPLPLCVRKQGTIPEGQTATFTVMTQDDTAQAPGDYTAIFQNVTINSGSADLVCVPTISAQDDTLVEGSESLNAVLTSRTDFVTVGLGNTVVTILDNDALTVGFISPSYVANEDLGTVGLSVCFDIQGTIQDGFSIVLTVYTEDGTAQSGSDYGPIDAEFTYTAFTETPLCINVIIIDDNVVEGNETFTLRLNTSREDLVTFSRRMTTVTILDNDITEATSATTSIPTSPTTAPTSSTDSCSGNFSVANGDYQASYVAFGDSVMFSVSARTSGWVAIGISNDGLMPNTDIVVGATDGMGFFVNDRYAFMRVQPPEDMSQDISNAVATLQNGFTTVTFTRPRNSTDSNDISLDQCRYLLYAYGSTVNVATRDIAYHGSTRGVLDNSFCLPSPDVCPVVTEATSATTSIPTNATTAPTSSTGFLNTPSSIVTLLRPTASVPFLCSSAPSELIVSLSWIVDGFAASSSMIAARGISVNTTVLLDSVSSTLSVMTTAENNDTNVQCVLTALNDQVTSGIATLTLQAFVVGFEEDTYVTNEGGGTLSLCVRVIRGVSDPEVTATVTLSTQDGTAVGGMDYTPLALNITLTGGSSQPPVYCALLSIVIRDDGVPEGAESFSVGLTSTADYVIVNRSSTVVTILDNDISPSSSVDAMIVQSSPQPAVVVSSSPQPAVIVSSSAEPALVVSSSPQPAVIASSSQQPIVFESSSAQPAVVVSTSPLPGLVLSSSPQPALGMSSSPQPIVVESSSPQPAVVVSSSPQPIVVVSSSPQPIVVVSSSPQPIVVESSSPQPAAIVTSSAQPVAVPSSSPQPAVVPSSSPPLVVVVSSSPPPSVVVSSSPQPAVVSSSPQLAVVESSSPPPSVVVSSSSQPAVVASSSPQPAVVESSSPPPSVVASSSPLPGVVLSSSPQPAVVVSSSPQPAVVSSSPQLIAVESSSPQPAVVSSSPQPIVVESSSPQPAVVSSSPQPIVVESSSPQPGVVASSSPQPAVVVSSSPQPAVVVSSSPQPAVVSSSPQPAVVVSSSPQPAVVSSSPQLIAVESSSPQPAVVSSSPQPIVVESSSPQPAVVSSSPQPIVVESSSPQPGVVASSSPQPAVVVSSSPQPAVVVSSSPQPAVVSSSAQPALVVSSSPQPAVVVTSSPQPAVVVSSSPQPAVVSSSPQPAVVVSSSPQPAVVVSSSPQPAVVASSSPQPAVVVSSSPQSTVVVSSSPQPAIAVSSSPQPAVVTSSSPQPAAVVSTSPVPGLAPSSLVVAAVTSALPSLSLVASSSRVAVFTSSSAPVSLAISSPPPTAAVATSSVAPLSSPAVAVVASSLSLTEIVASSSPAVAFSVTPSPSPSPVAVIIGFEEPRYVVNEDAGSLQACITIVDGPPGVTVPVNVTAQSGSAQAGVDYEFPSVLSFPALSSRTCIQDVAILNDNEVEGSETFTLTLTSSSSNVAYSNRIATITIVDDDTPTSPSPSPVAVIIGFEEASYVVNEDAGSLQACITIVDGPPGVTVPVNVTAQSGSAQAGLDYEFPSVLSFPALSSRTCIQDVAILNDNEMEGSETFTLTLTSSSSNVAYSNRIATITIVDDDIQPPQLRITADTAGLVEAGDMLSIRCEVTYSDILSPRQLTWLDPSGNRITDTMNSTMVGPTVSASNGTLVDLMFIGVRTSQAGQYTCEAAVHTLRFGSMTLTGQFLLRVQLPPPMINIFHSADGDPIYAGSELTISCITVVNSFIDTPVSAQVSWLPTSVYEDDRIEITPANEITSAIHQSNLVFDPILLFDSFNYTCLASSLPANSTTTPFIVGGNMSSATIEISVEIPSVTVTISPSSVTILNVAPFNTYIITCNATLPRDVMFSAAAQVTWEDTTTATMFGPNDTVSITAQTLNGLQGGSSTLSVTETRSGVFRPRCTVRVFSGGSDLTTAISTPATVIVRGLSFPVRPENVTILGVSHELVFIQWEVLYIAYTPETYQVQYRKVEEDDVSTSVPITGSTNFSAVNENFTFALDGLDANSSYIITILSSNTVGTNSSVDVTVQTRATDIYINSLFPPTIEIPLGAQLSIFLSFSTRPLGLPVFMLYPLFHSPLQQPTFRRLESLTDVEFSYSHSSPSLTGTYVACRSIPIDSEAPIPIASTAPAQCGRKISILVTIPSLTISTNLLVNQYSGGSLLAGESPPQVSCTPSDSRAPVQWTTLMGVVPQDYQIIFSPRGLSHTATFASVYVPSPPNRTETLICDLINADQPNTPVNPQNVTVRFIQTPVALLNNDKELLPDPIINSYNTAIVTNQAVLNLRCIATDGNARLQWLTRDVDVLPQLITSSSIPAIQGLEVAFWDSMDRDTTLAYQPVSDQSTGYYSCRSDESGYEVQVYTTLINPLWEVLMPTVRTIEFPIGAVVTFTARHADSSTGDMNLGSGFRYVLMFLPCVATMPDEDLESGITSRYSNLFTYSFRASIDDSGVYQLNATHIMTGQVFSNETNIGITIPHLVEFDTTVYVQRGRNVTLRCIPNDTLAPVLWRIPSFEVELERDPETYILSPPGLSHTALFNATAEALRYSQSLRPVHLLSLLCGFINGDDTSSLFTRQNTELYIQSERLRIQYSASQEAQVNILNNTYINSFFSLARSKREISFSVDCFGAQGDHNPVWRTDNPLLGDGSGAVAADSESGSSLLLSNYSTRFQLFVVTPEVIGTYSCVSQRSGLLSQFFLTTENPYVRRVSPPVVTVFEGDPVRLEFVVAVDSNGNTWNDDETIFTFTNIQQQRSKVEFEVYSSDFPQNFALDIASVDRSDEGTYNASVRDLSCEEESGRDCLVEESITLNVIKFCPREVSGGILWPRTAQSTTASAPCSEGGDQFLEGLNVTRQCTANGEWEEADFIRCTLAQSDESFLLLWFVIEADVVTDTLINDLEEAMEKLLDSYGVQYKQVTLQSTYIASVAVTFAITLDDASAQNPEPLNQFVNFFTNDLQTLAGFVVQNGSRGTLGVIPTDSCPCVRSASAGSIELCAGALTTPCDCDPQCQCQDPFVGDGVRCTLDSDGDGFPDQPLQSPSCSRGAGELPRYCQQDVCVSVSNPDQNPMSCEPDVIREDPTFDGCPYGPDPRWNITWANTPSNTVDTQRCPGGVDTLGNATRRCMRDGNWEEADVLDCESLQFLRIRMQAEAIFQDGTNAQLLAQSTAITLVLNSTAAEVASLLPTDLNTTNNILSNVIDVLEESLSTAVATPEEAVADVLNTILEENHVNGWMDLQEAELPGSQVLLDNAERYGLYVARSLNDTNQTRVLSRENIVISAKQLDATNMDELSLKDEVFPMDGELVNYTTQLNPAQIVIPRQVLLDTLSVTGESIPIVHILFRNLEDFLPEYTEGSNTSQGASAVVSSQVGSRTTSSLVSSGTLEQNPVSLMFNFTYEDEAMRFRCAYWNFSEPVGNGSWEFDGITTTSNMTDGNITSVQCLSTHLTSFAVLVDVAGALQNISDAERQALQIVSYIGCSISVICLIISVVFFLWQGKKLFIAVHLFVHLNLSISLLLGYFIFMVGIETGTSSTGGCAFVAALLQYIFLAAFCWMMCEGVMLYLMLVVVFSKLSKRWWFFLLLGWLPPLPIVVISVASRYQYYGVRDENGNLRFCWLSAEEGTIFAFVVPMLVIILINVVFLCFTVRALWRSKRRQTKIRKMDKDVKILELAKTTLKATVILLPLLGLTWVFGILTVNRNATVFAWLFTIFNSLQGVGILFFHVIRSEKIWSKIGPRLSTLRQRTLQSTLRSRKYEVSSSGGTTLSKSGTYKSKGNDYELSTLPKYTSTSEATNLTSVASSDPESETSVSKVPLEGEKTITSFANPLAEKLPLSADDEVIANPVTNGGPEEATQTKITMDAAVVQEKVESSPSLEKELDP